MATQDTVTQLIAAVRRVRREVPDVAGLIAQRCHAHDWADPGKPSIAWDDRVAREALVSALVNDANLIVDGLSGVDLDEPAGRAVALLALVAGQDVEPADGSDGTDGRWRIGRKVAPDRVISPVDPETRHLHKTVHHRQDGYKAHVAVELDTGLFTAGRLTKAAGDDHEAVVGLRLLADDPAGAGGLEVLGDCACGTGDACAALAAAGHTAVTKPAPLRPAVAGWFTLDDFTVNEAAATATCPTVSPGRSPPADTSPSARPAAAFHCGSGAPPPTPAAR